MNKKILICNPFLSLGGIGTFTITLGKSFRKMDSEILFLATHYEGDLWQKAKGSFDKVFSFQEIRNPIFRIFKIIRLIKILKPDVIIINDCPLANYSLPFINPEIEILSVIHSDSKRYYFLGTCFSGWINFLVCPSNKLVRKTQNFLPESDQGKIKLIPHGVDIPEINRQKSRIENSIIFIGNLDSHKGVSLLPAIIAMVNVRISNARFIIVGRGPMKGWLFDMIKAKDLNNVKYIPELTKEELYDYLSMIEILLLPTRLESFGLVIVEAMASGVIPIVSHLEHITDQFVCNGENGFLCDMNNPEEFSKRIIDILTDPGKKSEMSSRAREVAIAHFSDQKMINSYQEVLDHPGLIVKPDLFSPFWFGLFLKNVFRILRNYFHED